MNKDTEAFKIEQENLMKERKELIETSKTLSGEDHMYLCSIALSGTDTEVQAALYEAGEKQEGRQNEVL
jgi:hypothetical protein